MGNKESTLPGLRVGVSSFFAKQTAPTRLRYPIANRAVRMFNSVVKVCAELGEEAIIKIMMVFTVVPFFCMAALPSHIHAVLIVKFTSHLHI